MSSSFEYVEPQPGWPSWYGEYRFGAFYLFPPPDIRTGIGALRARYDPAAASICDAHISLTVPLPRAMREEDLNEIGRLVAGVASFDVVWGPLHRYPGVPGVVLRIAPAPQIAALVEALESSGCFAGAPARRFPFSPHMTIAEFISLERTDEILLELADQLLTGQWRCADVAYAVPDAQFHFAERMTWPLS
jgi:2'-5' RNA ligase